MQNNTNNENDNNKVNRFEANRKYFTISVYAVCVALICFLLYKSINDLDATITGVKKFFGVLSPFIIGAFIAFVLNPIVKRFYNIFFVKYIKIKSDKARKYISIAITYIIAIGFIALLMVVIVPQLYSSVVELAGRVPQWFEQLEKFLQQLEERYPTLPFLDYETINNTINNAMPQIINYVSGIASNLLPLIYSTSVALISGIFNLIIAIIVSVYMISDHSALLYNAKRVMYAFLPKSFSDKIINVLNESGRIFGGFIGGKAVDSLIIGCICFIAMLIFRFPYAMLISVIVGITNMIPYFGPYMGGFIGGIIIVIVNPIQVIFFAILILVIQQFDGLYLGPKILGGSTGLKPLWVIFAITVGGSLFGILGMFLGVPCLAVIGFILNSIIDGKLLKKGIMLTQYPAFSRGRAAAKVDVNAAKADANAKPTKTDTSKASASDTDGPKESK